MNTYPDSAKNEAILTVQKLVVASYATSLIVVFLVPIVIPWVLSSTTQEPYSTIVRVLITLSTGIFWWWFSANRLSSIVNSAIDSAVYKEVNEYKKDNPTIEEVQNTLMQEYFCFIPEGVRSKEVASFSSPSLCDERAARDAIFIGLAHNEKALQEAALAARELTLANKTKYVDASDAARKRFLADIYTYLRAWLMMSISCGRYMPVKLINQRFPQEGKPDKELYLHALENAKKVFHTPKIANCISEEYRQRSLTILDNYCDHLIEELKTPKKVNQLDAN